MNERRGRSLFLIDPLNIEEGAPRTLDFVTNTLALMNISAKHRHFPCNVSLDTSYTNYEFFVSFGNKTPTEYKYDAYYQSNKAAIMPPDDSEYNKLTVLIKSYKSKKVTVTVSFACK